MQVTNLLLLPVNICFKNSDIFPLNLELRFNRVLNHFFFFPELLNSTSEFIQISEDTEIIELLTMYLARQEQVEQFMAAIRPATDQSKTVYWSDITIFLDTTMFVRHSVDALGRLNGKIHLSQLA